MTDARDITKVVRGCAKAHVWRGVTEECVAAPGPGNV